MKKMLIVTSALVAISATYTADDLSIFIPKLRSVKPGTALIRGSKIYPITVTKVVREDKYGLDERYNPDDAGTNPIEWSDFRHGNETWETLADRIQTEMGEGQNLLQLLIISNSTGDQLQLNLEKDLDKPVSETNLDNAGQIVAVFSKHSLIKG